MADWRAIRQRAYAQYLRLCLADSQVESHGEAAGERAERGAAAERGEGPAEYTDSPGLLTAERILALCAAATGVRRTPVPIDDPLLAGAHAVLDRDASRIWYASGHAISQERQRFAQAHEFAHYWLHPELAHDAATGDDAPDRLLPPGDRSKSAQVVDSYSPSERRECEANLFAAELLAPSALLRHAFFQGGADADSLSKLIGVSESCILSQLSTAVLLPPPRADGAEAADVALSEPAGTVALTYSSVAETLDPDQRTAAEVKSGPVLVEAGPGTGKTRTLVARILYLLQQRGVRPESILALTFTNKAAEEMRTRLRAAVGEAADRAWIGTFHGFGYELLKREGWRLGLPPSPRLLELADAVEMLERSLDRLDLQEYEYLHFPALPFPDILSCISRAKDELKTPRDYYAAALRLRNCEQDDNRSTAGRRAIEAARVYMVYDELMREAGMLDFGDLVMRAVELLDAYPDVLARWRTEFRHVLADEYQDVNRASAQLVIRLAGTGEGLWAVGDMRQTICRWRGAAPANIREFEADFPGGRRLFLRRNYRSRPAIVRLFSAAAARMARFGAGDSIDAEGGFSGWLPTREPSGEAEILVADAVDEAAQCDGIAEDIRTRNAAGAAWSDAAVLCRTNRQAVAVAERLEKRGIPVQHAGDLFERAEVKDLLALLSLACEPAGAALVRVAGFRDYAIPPADVARVLQAAGACERPMPAALELAEEVADLSPAGGAGFRRLREHLEPIAYRGDAWRLITRYLFGAAGYVRTWLSGDDPASTRSRLAVYQFLTFAQANATRYTDLAGQASHTAFLSRLRRLIALGEDRANRLPEAAGDMDAVRVLTIHLAKGLEFPYVYVPNLNEGQFPPRSRGAMASVPPDLLPDGLELSADEPSLFFVALSRARERLVLCRPLSLWGRDARPSPLLATIRDSLKSAETVRWRATNDGEADRQTHNRPGATTREPASASALELYQTCPRRYYYERIARVRVNDEESPYRIFHNALDETSRWLQAETAAGRTPTVDEATDFLSAGWRSMEERSGAHVELLRARSSEMLPELYRTIVNAREILTAAELVAELEHGRVRVRPDLIRREQDGMLIMERHHKRRPRPDDSREERLALWREAARQAYPAARTQVVVRYLTDGSTLAVPATRYEESRVAKYDTALAGIAEGRLDPRPDDARCARCPFLFICPAG